MLDRLRSMEVFVVAADSGSFAAASDRLGMSSQMVARHVQSLEQRLQIRLLNRTTRRQSLTEFGKQYYDRCAALLAGADAADAPALDLQLEPHDHLRLSAPHQFGSSGR
ncbi:LysR family transcriptional regulator [Pseudomonas sp. CVAP|uniref:LysR family transcriptional regulator n=1 Tax=Pseudomonas sp. CVAP\|nr:LysR family transcriptional regulator [Pseudomonas sp. CVAP\